MRHSATAACLCIVALASMRADAQLRIMEQVSLTGTVEAVAAVLTDGDGYDLTAEIPVGTRSTCEAPASGRLHFRCADEWTALADNDGELAVTISRP